MAAFLAIQSCLPDTLQQYPDPDRFHVNEVLPPRDDPESVREDTSVFVSAVAVKDGYDWRRDTAAGRFEACIRLLCNGKERLRIPAGDRFCVSPSPDRHHLLGGDLYTEYFGMGGTVIKKNGDQVLGFPGREILLGLAGVDGNLHSLSRKLDGAGFVYRVNGETVMNKPEGRVFGSYEESFSGENGAFSIEDGVVRFLYCPSRYTLVLVEDGVESYVGLPDNLESVYDARFGSGSTWTLCRSRRSSGKTALVLTVGSVPFAAGEDWSNAGVHLHPAGNRFVVVGNRCDDKQSMIWRYPGVLSELGPPDCLMIRDGPDPSVLCDRGADGLEINEGGVCTQRFDGGHYLFSSGCMTVSGGDTYLLLNPSDSGVPCALWSSAKGFMEISGADYLSAVSVVINPASSGHGPRQPRP